MGIKEEHGQTAFKNAWNAALMVLVALPAVLLARDMFTNCSSMVSKEPNLRAALLPAVSSGTFSGFWSAIKPELCALAYKDPVSFVNVSFFVNLNVLFWVIGRIIGNDWLIDPYWQFAPLLIVAFYALHPDANPDALRSGLSLGLIIAWGLRLAHSYFRREEWNFGAREDWRFTEMKKQQGALWTFSSFFIVYVPQQLMLVGLTLPYYGVFLGAPKGQTPPSLGLLDWTAAALSIAGLLGAYAADTTLREFVVENEERKARGHSSIPVLDSGLFRYSRHPNHFFETLHWFGIALFGVSTGQSWTIIGWIFNTLIMIKVGYMVEDRMLSRKERAAQYKKYIKRTSFFVPWFPGSASSKDSE